MIKTTFCSTIKCTVEKLDYVSEVHVVVDDDFTVVLNKCQSNKENKVWGTDVFSRPNRLPHSKDVIIDQFCNKSYIQRLKLIQ